MYTYDVQVHYYRWAIQKFHDTILPGLELANPVFLGQMIYLPENPSVILAQVEDIFHMPGLGDIKPRTLVAGKCPHYLPREERQIRAMNEFIELYARLQRAPKK